jgi:polyphosphate kinase 2 (PPK2 family)
VHPEFLSGQKLPASVISKDIWTERFEDIRSFENHLTRSGTVIRKFYLNVSKAEQKKRFIERLDDPEKHWKFSAGDVKERAHWAEYMKAYEETIRATATKESPWFVVPADQKWFTRIVVAAAVIDALAGMDLKYPKVTAAMRADNEAARKVLLAKSGV